MVAVEYIIERELLGGRSVALPFVGTLSVAYTTAHVGPDSAVAPHGVLSLDDEFRQECSLILMIANEFCSGQYDRGVDLYNIWLATCSDGHTLHIDGVCRITLSNFAISTDVAMDALLHPAGYEPIYLPCHQSIPLEATSKQFDQQPSTYDPPLVHHSPMITQSCAKKSGAGVVGLVLAIVLIVVAITYVSTYFYFGG